MPVDKMSLETMIFQAGSELATHKPGAKGNSESGVEVLEEVEGKSDSDTLNERTPRQQDNKRGKANTVTSEGPYETPVILRTKPWTPSAEQVDDTEADDSETERVVIMKKKKATTVSSNHAVYVLFMIDVRCSLFHI
jgi:hypothetical protein